MLTRPNARGSIVARFMLGAVLALALAGVLAPVSAADAEFRNGAKKAGHAAGSVAREIGHGAKRAGKTVSGAAKEGGKEFRRALRDKSD